MSNQQRAEIQNSAYMANSQLGINFDDRSDRARFLLVVYSQLRESLMFSMQLFGQELTSKKNFFVQLRHCSGGDRSFFSAKNLHELRRTGALKNWIVVADNFIRI